MYDFHGDTKWYFEMQTLNAEKSVIPFIEEIFPLRQETNVLEVGCAEGGVLRAFAKRNCYGIGVELDLSRLEKAKELNQDFIQSGQLNFIGKNIYDSSFLIEFQDKFDLIVLKDVIEHIHEQEKIMIELKRFLKPGGYIFFGFPPFRMPFGGHQQVANSKIFSKIPYTHLLPRPVYKKLLQWFGVSEDVFLEIQDTGISTARFERIVKDTGLKVVNERHYFLNPIYEYKFGWKPIVQSSWIKNIPHLRDFLTTCVFYLVKK